MSIVQTSNELVVASGTSGNIVFPSATTPGNAIILLIANDQNSGNQFTSTGFTVDASLGGPYAPTCALVLSRLNLTAAATSYTVNYGGAAITWRAIAFEVSGLVTSGAVEVFSTDSDDTTTAPNASASPGLTTTGAGFIAAVYAFDRIVSTISGPSGWTASGKFTDSGLVSSYWAARVTTGPVTGERGGPLTVAGGPHYNAAMVAYKGVTVPDTTVPTQTGTITIGTVTGNSIQMSWPAGSDNVAVTSYEVSKDGGSAWTDTGSTTTSYIFTGLAAGTSYTLMVRAKDAAGNVSTPALTATQSTTTPDTTVPTLTGTMTVGTVTASSIQVSWPAGADNVAVSGYETSPDGTTWIDRGNVLTYTFTGLSAGTSYTLRVRAKDAAGNVSTPALSVTQSTSAADASAPTLTGTITVSSITQTGYTLAWPAGADNVAVASYERSLDGGASWVNVGNVTTINVTGRTAGTTDAVQVRAKDAAGNVSSPALSTSVTLLSPPTGTITTPPLSNNGKQLLPPLTSGWTVFVFNAATRALIATKTGLSTDSSSRLTFSDAGLTAGTTYAYEPYHATYGGRLPTGVAA